MSSTVSVRFDSQDLRNCFCCQVSLIKATIQSLVRNLLLVYLVIYVFSSFAGCKGKTGGSKTGGSLTRIWQIWHILERLYYYYLIESLLFMSLSDILFLLVCSGTLVTQWYTGSGQWYSPILRGGMTYSGGYITVPKDGIYYIYAQLHYDPRSIQNFCGLLLYLNDRIVDYAYAQNQSPNGNQWGSRYTGLMKIVNKEDTLSVKVAGPCYYCFYTETSQFGAFRVD